jgi:hypothetical protein
VRQSIVESTETCIHSCFSLAFNGVKLNDFMELGVVEGITPDSELDLVLSMSEERALLHACCFYFGFAVLRGAAQSKELDEALT